MKKQIHSMRFRTGSLLAVAAATAGILCVGYAQENGAIMEPASETVTEQAMLAQAEAPKTEAPTQAVTEADAQAATHSDGAFLKSETAPAVESAPADAQLAGSNTATLPAEPGGELYGSPAQTDPVVFLPADMGWGEGDWGDRWRYNFGLELVAYYDSNLFLDPSDESDDFIFVLSPMIAVGRGDIEERKDNFVEFRYQPALLLYMNNSDQNNVNHDASAELFVDFGKLSLDARVQYLYLSGLENDMESEVSGVTQRQIFLGHLVLEQDLTFKTTVSFEQDTILSDYESPEVDSNEYVFRGFVNYRMTEKTRLGLGGVFGYLDVPGEYTQTYEQLLLRVEYIPSPKLLVAARGGVELRQYEDDDRVSPRLALTAEWLPYVNTTFFANLFIREKSSALYNDQSYTNYGGELGVRQKFLQKFQLALSGGYQVLDYVSATTGEGTGLEEDYFFGRAAVSYSFRKWLSAEMFYLFRENTSTDANNEWTDNQVGIRVGTQF